MTTFAKRTLSMSLLSSLRTLSSEPEAISPRADFAVGSHPECVRLLGPLNRERREFRLVRIHDDTPGNGSPPSQIVLTFEHASLDDPPPYVALLYTWGDERYAPAVAINGISTTLRQNLYDALLQLRKNGLRSWIWIDAICINQSDNQSDDAERSWQVNEMRTVLSQAEQVYTWLGPEADDSDVAMHLIRAIAREAKDAGLTKEDLTGLKWKKGNEMLSLEHRDHREKAAYSLGRTLTQYEDLKSEDGKQSRAVRMLEALLHRDYFSRVWVIQELALAKECELICGESTVLLQELLIAIAAIKLAISYFEATLAPGKRREDFFFPFDWTYTRLKALEVRRALATKSGVRFCYILQIYHAAPSRPVYAATDPRDVVFGLLGCVRDAEALGIRADYTISAARVFADMTRAFLAQCPEYKLEYCAFPKETPNLPSWVPDWQLMGRKGIKRFPVNYSGYFKASGQLPKPTDLGQSTDWNVLRWTGYRVEAVAVVMEPPRWHWHRSEYLPGWMDNERKWYDDALRFHSTDPPATHGGEDALWRTMALDKPCGRSSCKTTPE
ncbi:Uu.00g028690.m01.CDS01 [Anthostomella pinea]|uniref:Uu.00g028690.m01.CDS01 n=1 Tax=Anthostomella pinea TaxID=933095 RepID=A0AAI8V7Z7_9PEZI|nr:Uu.00g028690.m01.CDS01 [Anthostomella pinea]